MSEIEQKKKEKRMKIDQKLLITWGMGFIFVVVIESMVGKYSISVSKLATLGIVLVFLGAALPAIVGFPGFVDGTRASTLIR